MEEEGLKNSELRGTNSLNAGGLNENPALSR